jgi:phosphoserine phosphatase RsbU/P
LTAVPESLLEETAEDLYENAPCGYLSTALDGTIVRVNRTFENWTGRHRRDLVGTTRFQELLTRGGQIYFETHYSPLLQMQGTVREIAVDIRREDGSILPALVNSVLLREPGGEPAGIRTTVFDATDRRRYEQELLAAREHEREVAHHLQVSMLPDALPSLAPLEVGVAYRSGETALEVGGDWYDAFWLEEDRRMLLVVGDVVGRGLAAAAAMGQLRSATRALALTLPRPSDLLTALDLLAGRHGFGRWSTVVGAVVDLDGPSMTYGCAGHLPPILAAPGATPTAIWGGRSAPLDAHIGGPPQRDEETLALEPGTRLVLYTDGLIERPGVLIDERIAWLEAAVARGASQSSQELADSLLDAVALGGGLTDDACVLVATLQPL